MDPHSDRGAANFASLARIPPVTGVSTGALATVAGAVDPASAHSGADRITEILTALMRAVGAEIGAVHRDDGAGRLVAIAAVGSEGGDPDPGAALARVVAATGDGDPAPLGPDAAEALASLGQAAGLGAAIMVQGRARGAIWVAGADPGHEGEARAAFLLAADRIGAAVENIELRESLERAMAQILERDERMLGRIGLDIHDGPTQQLSVALLEVQLLEAELAEADRQGMALPEALRPAMTRIYETVGGALHEMRELIGHLRPAQFEDRALPEILGDAITAFEARSGAEVSHSFVGKFAEDGISITQRITFYRVLQEALANAHRHGSASRCEVRVEAVADGLRMRVSDNGSGFDVEHAMRPRAGTPMARFGLHGMRDRAELLGGTCDIESAEGQGSTITIFLPRWNKEGGDGD